LTAAATLPDQADEQPLPRSRTERYNETYFAVLLFAVAAYAFTGKGFAYAGVAPFFPSEMILCAGLVTLVRPAFSAAIFACLPNLLLVLLMGWTLARTIPFVGEYKVDALRDSVIVMYGLFGFIFANLILEKPARIDRAVRWAGTFYSLYGATAVLLYVTPKFLGDLLPRWPGTDVTLIMLRGGEVAVQLGGAALFALLGLKRSSLPWIAMLLVGVVVISAQSRGGMLAILVPVMIAVLLTGHFKGPLLVLLAIVPIVVVLYVGNVEIPLESDRRTVNVSQVLDNAASIFMRTDSSDTTLDDTKLWRLQWWDKIIGYTINGDYFWTGKGFGISIAESDGFLGTEGTGPPLRSPHSAHMTILSRSGVPGLILWISVGVAWLGMMLRQIYRSKIHGDREWSLLLIFVLCDWIGVVINSSFDVALEGPMVGILFWVLFGAGTGLCMTYKALCRERFAAQRLAGRQA
jgi:hypothetical protein